MRNFKVSDKVTWEDPEDGTTQAGEVVSINGEVFSLKMESGGEIEAFENELTRREESDKPKIVVRVEKTGASKGTVLGVYADKSLEQGVDRQDGHFNVDHEWFLKSTRPASAEEEATFCEWYEPHYGECELVKRRY